MGHELFPRVKQGYWSPTGRHRLTLVPTPQIPKEITTRGKCPCWDLDRVIFRDQGLKDLAGFTEKLRWQRGLSRHGLQNMWGALSRHDLQNMKEGLA